MDILDLTAIRLSEKIKERELTAVEATKAVLEQIVSNDDAYNCYVTVEAEKAIAQAEQVQEKIDAGELNGPLAGVPVAIKDNICTKGTRTTCSSRILGDFVPTYTATAAKALEAADRKSVV